MEVCEYEDEQRAIVRGTHGLYVGMLSPEELEAFNYLCDRGHARRVYHDFAGVMGVAKVDLHPP